MGVIKTARHAASKCDVLFLTAIECDCPPWFPDGTWAGNWTFGHASCDVSSLPERGYGSQVNYTCPEGFVFNTPALRFNGTEETSLTLTCGSSALWEPLFRPECVRESRCCLPM